MNAKHASHLSLMAGRRVSTVRVFAEEVRDRKNQELASSLFHSRPKILSQPGSQSDPIEAEENRRSAWPAWWAVTRSSPQFFRDLISRKELCDSRDPYSGIASSLDHSGRKSPLVVSLGVGPGGAKAEGPVWAWRCIVSCGGWWC